MASDHCCTVHLVGSMSLIDVSEVMSTTAELLGPRAKRLTGGEVGMCRNWIVGHHRIFARHPDFEEYVHIEVNDHRAPNSKRRRFRLKPGAKTPTAESFGPSGYLEDAREGHALLRKLKMEGKADRAARLLVAIPSPYDVLNFAVDKRDFPALFPVYEQYLLSEMKKIAAEIPLEDLAFQWDAAHEFEYLATSSPAFNPMTREEIIALLVRLGDGVPAGAELGYHCCYGMFNMKHFVEPTDLGDVVEVMNAVIAGVKRPVDFVQMPVPLERTDDAYFAPLTTLDLSGGVELYLGLVHDIDGVEGSLKRAAVASKVVKDFGIATECGLGGRTPENIRQILQIQAQVADALNRERGVAAV